jgi:nitroreductase
MNADITEGVGEHARVLAGQAQYLIATAARAPSLHNSQPWRFRVGPDAVELWCDPRRRPWSDASGREMLISCGAALFGLRLAVRSLGFQPVVDLLPDPARLRLLARVRPGRAGPMNALETRMLAAVPHRHTHRGPFEPGALPAGLLPGLQNDAFTEGAELALIPPGLGFERLARLTAAAARRGDLDSRARATIRRWTRAAGRPERDGIPATALAAGPAPQVRPGRLRQRDFDLGRNLGLLPAAGAPPAVTAVLLTRDDRRSDWLRAGEALHRMLLHAASEWVFASLYTQPLEDPVTRLLIPGQVGLPGHPQMILQLGRAMTAASTARRSPDEVNDAFRRASTGRLAGVLRYSVDPLVSRDIIGEKASCVFDSKLTAVSGPPVKLPGCGAMTRV